jgi:hypothetical protein
MQDRMLMVLFGLLDKKQYPLPHIEITSIISGLMLILKILGI